MYKSWIVTVVGVFALWSSCYGQARSTVSPGGVGLVLSGGGAKGIAHIGVIQALEEQGVAIDYITGTSMGAIVGGLYAAGYSPEDMLELIESRGFSYWSTGRVDQNLVYYFDKEPSTPAMVTLNLSGKGRSAMKVAQVPSSLISPLPMNFAFMELFAPYTAQCGGDFNRLFVPFRCVASDVAHKRKKVFGSGRLGDAIRSSMSFPLVFQPIKVDGDLMYDGGIYDNFPVDVMRSEFHPSVMLGVDVSADDSESEDFLNQLENLIIQNDDYDLPAGEGVKMRIDLDEFSLLDFPKARAIYKIGYDRAMEMMDSIKVRITARRPAEIVAGRRAEFRKNTPSLAFRSVTTTGGTRVQNNYITKLFTHGEPDDTFGIKRARDSYYRAITGGLLRNLMPQASYDKASGLYDLALEAVPNESLRLRIGGYVTSSINSMVYVSAGYRTMNYKSLCADVSAWVGQSYMAASANVGIHLRADRPSSLTLEAVVSRRKFYENDRMFYRDNVPSFVTDMEAFSRLNYSISAGRHGKLVFGAGYGYMEHRYYNKSAVDGWKFDKDRCSYSLGQLRVGYDYNTLNNESYPSSGARIRATAIAVTGRYRYYPSLSAHSHLRDNVTWGQAEVALARYWQTARHFAIGGRVNAVYSMRKLLNSYDAAIVGAPAFYPTATCSNLFNPGMRANSYATAGVEPIWLVNDNLQLRGSCQLFMPWRRIECAADGTAYYGSKLSDPGFFGEIAGVYNFSFASFKVYANYMSSLPGSWNFGLSFGLFFLAPEFMK